MSGSLGKFGGSGGARNQQTRPPSRYRQLPKGTGSVRRRVLAWLAAGLAFCLVVVSLTAYLKFRAVWDSIHRVQVTGLGSRPPKFTTALNILLIGSDTRSGKNARFGAGITGQRSDTVIVLHVAPGGHSVTVLSIPRDSVVPILSCPPEAGTGGQAAQPGQVEQINATFSNGGPGCLWRTVEQTTHVRIDHFIALNFTGFEHVINDIGGVSICLPFAINDPLSKLHLGPGRHHVGGAEALAFWRARYIGEGSDLQRIQRDQFLMASILQGVEHTNLRASPTRLLSVITDAARSMTTDTGLSLSTLTRIVESLRNLRANSVQFVELPTVPYPANPNWVQWPPTDAQLFAAIAHDRSLPRTASKTRPVSPVALTASATADLTVRVLNGAGIAGIARQAAGSMAARGVHIAGVGNASGITRQSSVVLYPAAASRPAAVALRSLLGPATLELDPALRPGQLTVVVGADYEMTRRAAPTPKPTDSPQNFVRKYGGITGGTNVCNDRQAFAGPRGGS